MNNPHHNARTCLCGRGQMPIVTSGQSDCRASCAIHEFRARPAISGVSDKVDNPADDTTIIDARLAARWWEAGSDMLKSTVGKPVMLGHGHFLLPT